MREKYFISRDNGVTWIEQKFNLFDCVDGELYNGGPDLKTIFKVSKVDNRVSSVEYNDYVGLPQF